MKVNGPIHDKLLLYSPIFDQICSIKCGLPNYTHKLSHNQTLSARHQLRVADATQNSFICLRELAHNYYLESPLGANSMQRHRRFLLLLAVRRIDWNLLRKCALCVVCSEQTLFKHICLTRSAFGGHIYIVISPATPMGLVQGSQIWYVLRIELQVLSI